MPTIVTKRSGFSLIEMVIALAILAAATTIAVRATSGLQDQARYQATTRSLTDLQSAIVGTSNQRGPDGSTTVSGFIADTGRLPQFTIDSNDPLGVNGDPLSELLRQNTLPAFGFVTANSDTAVVVGVGWKGPYIRLAAGPSYIRDGWGNSFHVYDASGNLLSNAGAPISQISSWAADKIPDSNHGGTGDTNGYDADVSVPYPNSTSGGFVYAGTLNGQVAMNVGTDTVAGNPLSTGPAPNLTYTNAGGTKFNVGIWVILFSPDLSQTPHPVGEALAANTSVGPSNALTPPFTYLVPGVTIGPRVIKAYVIDSSVLSPTANLAAVKAAIANQPNASTGPVFFTSSSNITVTGGGQTLPNLVLPHYSP